MDRIGILALSVKADGITGLKSFEMTLRAPYINTVPKKLLKSEQLKIYDLRNFGNLPIPLYQ